MRHTPEPWEYTDGSIWVVVPDQYGDPEQSRIAESHVDDARRIVACVNACAGIPNEELDPVLPVMVSMQKEINGLTEQRNELIVALKDVIHCNENFGEMYAGRNARDKAKAIIAKIEAAILEYAAGLK